MINKLQKFCNGVDYLSEKIARYVSYFLLILMFVVTYDVFMRYVFNSPTQWGFETDSFIYGFLVVLAGMWVLSINGHINVDIIFNKFGIRTRAVIAMITSLVIFAYLVFTIWATWNAAQLSLAWNEHSGSAFNPPLYPIKFLFPVGAGLFLLQSIARFFRFLIQALTGVEYIKEFGGTNPVEAEK